MARWRAIHPKISQSLDVEALSEWAQLLWDRIIANGDDWGRMRGEAALVKALCKPLSVRPVEDFEAALRELEQAGLIQRWQVGRQMYLQIGKWEEYQRAARDAQGRVYPKGTNWRALRRTVLERDGGTCVYCGDRATCVDHVIPFRRGGSTTLDNLVASCRQCNLRKHDRTPEEAGLVWGGH